MNAFEPLRTRALRASTVILACALLALVQACQRKDAVANASAAVAPGASVNAHEANAGGLQLSQDELQRAGIVVQALQAAPGSDAVSVTATIKANQDRLAHVSPRVDGRIVSTTANLGDHVRAGQLLATLDSVALGEAQADYRKAQSAQRVADSEFQRARSLAADEIIPQRDLLRARAELEKADAELAAARDKLTLLGAQPGTAPLSAGFQLRSPIDGTVIEKRVTVGGLATPADTVFTVADLSTVWIEANLTENLLARVQRGAEASVVVAAYPNERFTGRVTYIAGVMDKDTRVIAARIEVPNRDGRLKPEMFATASVVTGTTSGAVLSVPDGALILLQGQPTVFTQTAHGFEPRPVDPGEKLAGRTVIKSGLKDGDKVVVAGTYALKARLLKSQISEE